MYTTRRCTPIGAPSARRTFLMSTSCIYTLRRTMIHSLLPDEKEANKR